MSDLAVSPEHSDDAVSADIRLLGRLLGDAIRATQGDDTFELVEHVRRLAVDGRRNGISSVDAIRTALGQRALAEQILVLRALDWLSLLANTAEDVHVERRRRRDREVVGPPRPGSMRSSIDRALAAGVSPEHLLAVGTQIQVTPVITAHPTEVRRKTILEVLEEVAELLDVRSRLTGPAIDEIERQLSVCVLLLWQTALLRLSKLRVRDEINEAIRYYGTSLFDVIPALTKDFENELATAAHVDGRVDATHTITMGSWIGGDRDGNPFVTAEVLRYAIHRQTETALEHHLRAVHHLSHGLSMTDRLVTPTPELLALAAASGDDSPFRADEPYRRALRGMHARLYAYARAVIDPADQPPGPPPTEPCPAYDDIGDLVGDLDTVISSLHTHGAGAIAEQIVEPVRRSVAVFGAHLCGLDMRQNSAVHERVIADLFAAAAVCDDYLGLDEAARVQLLEAELRTPGYFVTRAPPMVRSPGARWRSSTKLPRQSTASVARSCPTTSSRWPTT